MVTGPRTCAVRWSTATSASRACEWSGEAWRTRSSLSPGRDSMLLGELGFLFRRRRVQALLVVLALLPVAIALAVRFSGGPDTGEGPTFLNQVTNNGVFAALAGLTITLPVFLPL